jgi:hypothetical protein
VDRNYPRQQSDAEHGAVPPFPVFVAPRFAAPGPTQTPKNWLDEAWPRLPKKRGEKDTDYAERLAKEAAADGVDLNSESIRVRLYEHRRQLKKEEDERRERLKRQKEERSKKR